MKFVVASFLFGLVSVLGWGQEVTAQTGTSPAPDVPLTGTWVAKRIQSAPGSPVMSDDEVQKSDLVFTFGTNRLTLYTQGRPTTVNYTREGQRVRTVGGTVYLIEKLTPVELILNEQSQNYNGGTNRLKIYLARFEGSYQDYMFQKYVVPNLRFDGDTFYVMNEYVYPKFQGRGGVNDTFFENYQNSYEFIEDAFRQQGRPKRDRFRVSFMVSRAGRVEDIRIVESTDARYNDALIRAIRTTNTLWTPATANGKPARVQINYEFPYGLPEDRSLTLAEINQLKAKDLVQDGLKSFSRKRYAEALATFDQALALDPANVSIRLNRAATNYQLGQLDAACAEWRYLAANGDKQAARYVKRYCK
jgi:TonB family protein